MNIIIFFGCLALGAFGYYCDIQDYKHRNNIKNPIDKNDE